MTPPPTMTTSALSTHFRKARFARDLHHAPHLEDELERGEDGDLRRIGGRRDLDEVDADEGRPGGCGLQEVERLPRGEPAGGGDLCPRRERRVEDVDVKGHVHLLAGESTRDTGRRGGQVTSDLSRGDEQDPVRGDEVDLLRVIVAPTRDHDARRLDARSL